MTTNSDSISDSEQRRLTLTENVDGWWTACGERAGVITQGETRADAVHANKITAREYLKVLADERAFDREPGDHAADPTQCHLK